MNEIEASVLSAGTTICLLSSSIIDACRHWANIPDVISDRIRGICAPAASGDLSVVFRGPPMKPIPFVLAVFVATMAAAGCGNGENGNDVMSDVKAGDVAPEAAADTVEDSLQPIDATGEATTDGAVQDALPEDTADASIPDIPSDTTGDVPVDTAPEFHWQPGCTGVPTGASWTLVEDSTFKRGPLIQMSDRDTVTVVWRTATVTTDEGCVDYTVNDQPLTECGLPDKYGQYEITLDDLPAATEIHYSARVGETRTTDLTFRTMPDTPAPMKFAVFADAHCNIENLRKMTAIALAEGVDFAFGIGDFVHQVEVAQYDETFLGFQNLGSRVNIWTVIGNHDTGADPSNHEYEFFNSFVSPIGIPEEVEDGYGEGYWDRRIGNVWLGGGWVRDFYLSTPETEWGEVAFFKKRFESEEYKTAQWRLFFIHEPPYCQGWGGCSYSGESCLRTSLVPLAAANGIQAMFHGHMHGYEYGVTEGVHTILPGGLGGSLDDTCEPTPELPQPWTFNYVHNFAIVEANCDKLVVRFMNLDGGEYDRLEIPYVAPQE